ncbi:unnamed protein product [Didymodactylos carnosus]|uniref:Uncharacterized protein n=1 Tax=Didymodactylos carnosus TaxID=1234261 RepID=A0A815GMI8_9BILA|nr:unnamed protein product [Didymodactylos carnosus]CAF1340353.1 unnamed protein product [Didymodactylos carnosus]CAF3980033.1 unnamed protein product [Didymodactylos carnosus]CAF4200801.1 unnamed protein product [Didymodactylos carnosus]
MDVTSFSRREDFSSPIWNFDGTNHYKQFSSPLSPISADLRNEERKTSMEQQFESEYQDQLQQLDQAVATAKQIERELLAKVLDVGYTADSASQWLKFIELIWGKLNCPLVCWADGASQHLPSQAYIWYAVNRSRISDFDTFVANLLMEFETKPRFSSGSADANATAPSVPSAAKGPPLIVRQDPVELNFEL